MQQKAHFVRQFNLIFPEVRFVKANEWYMLIAFEAVPSLTIDPI